MNSKNSFSGTGKVFKFTLAQYIGAKGFKIVTIMVGIVAIAAMILINVIAASDDSTKVKNVYILDESGLEGADVNQLSEYNPDMVEGIEKVDIAYLDLTDKTSDEAEKELFDKVTEEEAVVGIHITNKDNSLLVTAYVDKEDELSEDDGMDIATYVSGYYDQLKFVNANLDEQQLSVLLTPVDSLDSQIGEENTSVTKTIVNMFAPMIFGLVLYFMLIIYGQSISKIVISEKSSKLMEYMLTSVKSEAMIAGKILAMVMVAIVQVVFWVACIIGGMFAGDYIGKTMNPDYSNVIFGLIKTIKNDAKGALTWQAVLIAFIAFVLGFLFYCVIAGLVASFAQKPEGLTQIMVIYQYTVIIGFFIGYFGSAFENKFLLAISQYVPICSPFTLAANVLIGAMSVSQIILSFAILIVATVIFIVLTARIYKSLVLYNGVKVTPAVVKNAILGSSKAI